VKSSTNRSIRISFNIGCKHCVRNRMSKFIPKILFTPGEPAGCGPDIAVKFAQRTSKYPFIVVADPDVLVERAKQLNLPLHLHLTKHIEDFVLRPSSHLQVFPVKAVKPVTPGKVIVDNVPYVLN